MHELALLAIALAGMAANLFSGLSIFPVVPPLGLQPVGREFISSSARWLRKQSRAFHNYGRRRHKPSSSPSSQPLVTPSLHRVSRTQPWPPPPTPTFVQQIIAIPAVQATIDAALQCQLPPLSLQPPACSLWDQPPASYTGPTSLNLYIPLALALYSPVIFPLVSTLPALAPAASLITLTTGAGSWQPEGELDFEFSWVCALLPLPFVLFALHKLFPSKGHRTSRTGGSKSAKKRKSKAKRKAAQVVSESPVVVPACPSPAQPVPESEVVGLFPTSLSTDDGVESAEMTVDDGPCVPEVAVVEPTPTESSIATLPGDEEPDCEGWIKVQRKQKEDKEPSSKNKQRKPSKSAKPMPSIPQPPAAKPTQARRGDYVQPWSVHYDPPVLKNKDLSVQRDNEALNATSVVQQVGPWAVPRRADGSATRVYRFPRAYPALSEVTPSNVSANRLRMLGPKRDRYVPNATFVGKRPVLSTPPQARTQEPTSVKQSQCGTSKGKGKAPAQTLPAKRKQDGSQSRRGTLQSLISKAIENPTTASPQERKRQTRPERRRSRSEAKATRAAAPTTWSA